MEIVLSTPVLVVTGIIMRSRARYAAGIKVGDRIRFTNAVPKSSARTSNGGTYSTYYDMYLNGKWLAVLSQNEIHRIYDIFNLEETGEEEGLKA
jgi:hypothetical protein